MSGQWREILLLEFQIHWEHSSRLSRRAQPLAEEGARDLSEGRLDAAETALLRALAIQPNAPELMNNLAAVYARQGRDGEAEELIRRAFKADPDYLFARTGMVHLHVAEGRVAKARQLLGALVHRKRFHFTEFAAFAAANIAVFIAEKNVGAARSWLDMWEDVDPDHPNLAAWRRRIALPRFRALAG